MTRRNRIDGSGQLGNRGGRRFRRFDLPGTLDLTGALDPQAVGKSPPENNVGKHAASPLIGFGDREQCQGLRSKRLEVVGVRPVEVANPAAPARIVDRHVR